jgi:uncharacterized protein with NAD-binding domain and iron-sulfur cluster
MLPETGILVPNENRKPTVVILGGGIASLTTAFELTSQPDWRNRFESITVYQMGWRLGGKGASGRNAQRGQRIEEHGLHVWPGFYDNAFDMMRRCYAELERPSGAPLATWEEAFKPHDFVAVIELIHGQWKPWPFKAPPNGDVPGNPEPDLPSLRECLARGLDLVTNWFEELAGVSDVAPPSVTLPRIGHCDRLLATLESGLRLFDASDWSERLRETRLRRRLRAATSGVTDLSENVLAKVASKLAWLNTTTATPHRQDQELVAWMIDRAVSLLEARLGDVSKLGDKLRRIWIQLDFACTALRGIVRDGVLENGFDVLDGEDFVSWMRRHGASRMTLESALMRGLHDFVFAYENADPRRMNLAAGVALRLIVRLTFTYKGAIFWKMQAGMGDAVFGPLYEVLRKRGVQFQFFHRVTALKVAQDGRSISEIILGRQATVSNGAYAPLIDVGGLPCWPNSPRYDQLLEGTQLQTRDVSLESIWTNWSDVQEVKLTAGKDFDVVVLGISLAALPQTCGSLIESNAKWRQMVAHLPTVKTQSAQLWFTPALSELGWPLPSPILTAYLHPLETWADMSQTLPRESWPAGTQPGSVAYFCSALSDDGPVPAPGPNSYPHDQANIVRDNTINCLAAYTRPLFPAACAAGSPGIDWAKLHDPAGGTGLERFDAQFWRANVQPTDRYVQSPAGTTRYRLAPNESGFRNLFVVGDWTRNGINVGCIEATVISGRRAARAMMGDVRPIVGERDRISAGPS